MKYLITSTNPVSDSSMEQPFTGKAFEYKATEFEGDPYERLAEIMAVVEELCPVWPERETFRGKDIFLL